MVEKGETVQILLQETVVIMEEEKEALVGVTQVVAVAVVQRISLKLIEGYLKNMLIIVVMF